MYLLYLKILVFSFFSYYMMSKIGIKLNLVDYPQKRKSHKYPVPFTGGIGICLIILFISLMTDLKDVDLVNITIYSYLIALVGIYDDKMPVTPINKIFLLLIPIAIMILNGFNISHIGIYGGIGFIELGPYSYLFTALCCLILINAVNYSDGIDGHAATVFISSILLLIFFLKFSSVQSQKSNDLMLFLSLFIIAIIVFIFFNHKLFHLPKLFLGDSGSLLLGFFLSFTIIYIYKLGVHPALLIWSICIFIFDFLSTNLIRIIYKKQIFKPTDDHFHHQVIKIINNTYHTNLISISTNIFFGLIGFLIFKNFGPTFSILIYPFLFLIFFYLKIRLFKNVK
jgi:UDP-GlcNAc:undecaprenyl-phosphate/decaprenyl-phosphate GlcNAc-1-phosphate transferase